MDAAGNMYVSNGTMCDCSTALGATGPFRGEFCQIQPPCDIEPCMNRGRCINGLNANFTCDCSRTVSINSTQPYSGSLCEISGRNVCDANPCENGGTCTPDPTLATGSAGRFTCACVSGWTGHTCNIAPTSGCPTPTHCVVGNCVPSSDPRSTPPFTSCVCSHGYTGPNCDVQPAACAGVSCGNGGRCVGFAGTETATGCMCSDPWAGDSCQYNTTEFIGKDEQ